MAYPCHIRPPSSPAMLLMLMPSRLDCREDSGPLKNLEQIAWTSSTRNSPRDFFTLDMYCRLRYTYCNLQ